MDSMSSVFPIIYGGVRCIVLWAWVRVIEKHVTSRREGYRPAGLWDRTVNRMIRHRGALVGAGRTVCHPAVSAAKVKLERSIATNKVLCPGDMITETIHPQKKVI